MTDSLIKTQGYYTILIDLIEKLTLTIFSNLLSKNQREEESHYIGHT